MSNEDVSLSTMVYRKPIHSDLYLPWESHHTIPSMYRVIGTLYHRAKTTCSNLQLLKQEEDHLHRALTKFKYLAWALNRVKIKSRNAAQKKAVTAKRTLELTTSRRPENTSCSQT